MLLSQLCITLCRISVITIRKFTNDCTVKHYIFEDLRLTEIYDMLVDLLIMTCIMLQLLLGVSLQISINNVIDEVRLGNVIERKGKIYQVVKAQHTTQGRGGAIIQVELRDVDSGNKVNERFRTDETVEKKFVENKSYTYLYTDDETDTVVLMEPKTFVQLDVPKHLFGNSLAYLKDDITVSVELFNDRPMSASVPKRVTCTVVEAQVAMKGMGATPQYEELIRIDLDPIR